MIEENARQLLESFPFHDSILNNILFDLESNSINMHFENENQNGELCNLKIFFEGVDNFRFAITALFELSEVHHVKFDLDDNMPYLFEGIFLLGFGNPSEVMRFNFTGLFVELRVH